MICWSCQREAGTGVLCGSCKAVQPPVDRPCLDHPLYSAELLERGAHLADVLRGTALSGGPRDHALDKTPEIESDASTDRAAVTRSQ